MNIKGIGDREEGEKGVGLGREGFPFPGFRAFLHSRPQNLLET